MQAGVSVRVIVIFAWPGATAAMIGCAGCDAQPAQQIAMNEIMAPIPGRTAHARYGGGKRDKRVFLNCALRPGNETPSANALHILAAMPRNVGAPERAARQCMPIDFYL